MITKYYGAKGKGVNHIGTQLLVYLLYNYKSSPVILSQSYDTLWSITFVTCKYYYTIETYRQFAKGYSIASNIDEIENLR